MCPSKLLHIDFLFVFMNGFLSSFVVYVWGDCGHIMWTTICPKRLLQEPEKQFFTSIVVDFRMIDTFREWMEKLAKNVARKLTFFKKKIKGIWMKSKNIYGKTRREKLNVICARSNSSCEMAQDYIFFLMNSIVTSDTAKIIQNFLSRKLF